MRNIHELILRVESADRRITELGKRPGCDDRAFGEAEIEYFDARRELRGFVKARDQVDPDRLAEALR